MNKFRTILEEGLNLAALDKLDQALEKLAGGVRDAADENDQKWVALLAKNAGLLFERTGQLEQAKASYIMALNYNESDPYLHHSLANICEKLGQDDDARHHSDACYTLATEERDEDLIGILGKSRN